MRQSLRWLSQVLVVVLGASVVVGLPPGAVGVWDHGQWRVFTST